MDYSHGITRRMGGIAKLFSGEGRAAKSRPGEKPGRLRVLLDAHFVREMGLEPTRPKTLEPKSSASANSATRA